MKPTVICCTLFLTLPVTAQQSMPVAQSATQTTPVATAKRTPARTVLVAGDMKPALPAAVAAGVTGHAASGVTVSTAVTVKAKETKALEPQPISSVEFTGKQILQSAGTFGDLPRYLQTLPGLIGGSDAQNASFVRGGNSFENLFVIDHIEVPNINHLALANSTGGLGSMLDTEFIANVNFRSGDMGSAYESHLSSVTDIRTLELPQKPTYSVDLGYTGGGFRINRPIDSRRTVMFSARESVNNLIMSDVGLNGSPEFTNSFSKYTWDISSRDHMWIDSLWGRDNLAVRPSATDRWETNAYNTDYSGWRNTTGLVWQHTYQSDAIGTLTISNSQNKQDLSQRDQVNKDALLFVQDNSDGVTQAKYQYMHTSASGSTGDMGVDTHMNRIASTVAQPAGIFSPYSASATPQDAFSNMPRFHTLDSAAYYNYTANIGKKLIVKAGARFENYGGSGKSLDMTCGTTGSTAASTAASTAGLATNRAFLPHVSASYLLSSRLNFRASYAKYAQLPPYATIASQPSNAALGLIHSQHVIAGMTASLSSHVIVGVEAYRKTYTGYPVSSTYPTVSLASMLPTIIEPFSILQMTSEGKGTTQGVEVTFKQSPWHHFFTEGNVAYSRALFTGADGIYRPGSADLPLVANLTGGIQVKKFLLTFRDTAASGRAYTPVLLKQSVAQNRPIYDLTQINALRGDLYNRLDLAVNREIVVKNGVVRIHGGVMNALNRQNFFEQAWRPRCTGCGPITEPSMGLQPDMGLSYTF
jgi:hypothetical protein